jgi:hypothetical protein
MGDACSDPDKLNEHFSASVRVYADGGSDDALLDTQPGRQADTSFPFRQFLWSA